MTAPCSGQGKTAEELGTLGAGRPLLGVIEGFYGPPPWSWTARDRMVGFLARNGFDLYVYAPKDEPFHRARWRDPYPAPELARFERLAGRCRRAGVVLVYGLSPVDVAMGDGPEIQTMWAKILQLRGGVGIRSFCLLFDDLPQDLPPGQRQRVEGARWQAAVANELLWRLREMGEVPHLLFTPTEYHGRGDPPYLRALGDSLGPDIDVFWTGREVCSRSIRAADVRAVTRSLGRAPLIWDNYPVNDGAMRVDPHLRPLRGRAADLPPAVRGIVANGAIRPEASKVAFHTAAAYWADPDAYDPEAAWQRALRAVARDAGAAQALRLLGTLCGRSPLERGGHTQPLPQMEAFWSRWESAASSVERRAAIAELDSELGEMGRMADRLRHSMSNLALQRDVAPWAAKLAIWVDACRVGLIALDHATEPPGSARVVETRRDLSTRLARARQDPHRVSDIVFRAFLRRCLGEGSAASVASRDRGSPRHAP